jgi:hypothetical protein
MLRPANPNNQCQSELFILIFGSATDTICRYHCFVNHELHNQFNFQVTSLRDSMRNRLASILNNTHPLLASIAFPFMIVSIATAQIDIKFSDVTQAMNARGYVSNNVSCYGHGAAMADVNGDSLPDILVSNAIRHADWIPGGLAEVFHISHRGMPYSDEAQARGVSDPYGWTGTHGICFFDYNNDGLYDVFNATTDDANRLYRNIGDGYFEDVTQSAQIPALGYGSRGVVGVDVNNDGFLDLYVVNWGPVETFDGDVQPTPEQPNEFYLNNGDGTFTKDDSRGLTPLNPSHIGTQGVTAVDVDNDQDMDIFVCHRNYAYQGTDGDGNPIVGPNWNNRVYNQLFINDGTGHFTEEAYKRAIFDASNDCNGTTFADYDNDGDLDAFVVPKDEVSDNGGKDIRIFKNDGNGYFEKIPRSVSKIQQWGFSALMPDVDNDGDLDLYCPRVRFKPNILYLNDGTGTFTEQPGTGLEKDCYDPRGGAIGDIDYDGKLDIYFVDANKDKDPRYSDYLFHNDTQTSNRWLKIFGRGPKGDMGAFGTKIWVFEQGHLNDMAHLIGYKQVVNAYGYLCQDDPVQHFGLGQRDTVDVKIMLLDGTVLMAKNVAANRRLFFSKPDHISKTDGDQQKGKAGQELARPLTAKVIDAFENPVIGVPVTFAVIQGNGHFVGDQLVYTDSEGLAKIRYVLGIQPDEQKISSGSTLIPGSSVQFSAFLSSEVAALNKTAGNNQTGPANAVLPNPVQVQVLDASQKPVSAIPLRFAILSGVGQIDNGDTVVVSSDPNGKAAVSWRLGKMAGNNKVRVTVIDQPTIYQDFSATSTHADPAVLTWLGKIKYTGIVGHSVSDSLIAVVADSFGNPVDAVKVSFIVQAGGGKVNGLQSTQILTDAFGQTTVRWVLGPVAGVENNVLRVEADGFAGSPVQVLASANADRPFKLSKGSSDSQSGCPNTVLSSPIVVAVKDTFENAISGHPVTFTVIAGDGHVNSLPDVSINTDEAGTARVTVSLGNKIGNVIIEASSSYLGRPLLSSPMTFTIYENCSHFDPGKSTLSATSSVIANGRDRSVIRFEARDQFQNSVPGLNVKLQASGGANTLLQPVGPTDANGIATGYLSSTKAETKQITLEVFADDTTQLTCQVVFVPTAAADLAKLSGNQQAGVVDSNLDSIRVALADSFQNPIVQAGLAAKYQNPLGEELLSLFKNTDPLGRASFPWHLGTRAGQYTVTVAHAELAPALFTAQATADVPDTVIKVSGSNQSAPPATVLPLPLVVRVDDKFANPISGAKVNFWVSQGGGTIVSENPAITDSAGLARAIWQLGSSGSQTVELIVDYPVPLREAFEAAITENQAPVFFCIADTTISEGRPLSLVVNAVDPEGSAVQVEATTLPILAHFEPETGIFKWTPGFDQAGDHQAVFSARDDRGNTAAKTISVHVLNVNQAPVILFWEPADSAVDLVYGEEANFSIGASDPDQDSLIYQWHFNGAVLAGIIGSSFTIMPNPSLPQHSILSAKVTDGQLFADKTWTLSQEPNSVEEKPLPQNFALGQNYPNPFNPSTTICWQTPASSHVRVTVFNTAGQLVRVLVNGYCQAGEQSVVWDARDESGQTVPSGIYYYELEAKGFHQIKKLLLLK